MEGEIEPLACRTAFIRIIAKKRTAQLAAFNSEKQGATLHLLVLSLVGAHAPSPIGRPFPGRRCSLGGYNKQQAILLPGYFGIRP